MLADSPVKFGLLKFPETDVQMIRVAIIGELDAINFYLQAAERAVDEKTKELFMEIARDEKHHVAELYRRLKEMDEEQRKAESKHR